MSNNDTAKPKNRVVDIDDLIANARIIAAQHATQAAEQKPDPSDNNVVLENPEHAEMIERLLSSDMFARHMLTGDGQLVDLDALSRRLDEQQMSNGSNTQLMPTAPPTDDADSKTGRIRAWWNGQ